MSDPEIPFGKDRVCFPAMTSGMVGVDGLHPRCLGPECSSWDHCLYDSLSSRRDIEDLLFFQQRYRPAKKKSASRKPAVTRKPRAGVKP
jgi:hypothetical protein